MFAIKYQIFNINIKYKFKEEKILKYSKWSAGATKSIRLVAQRLGFKGLTPYRRF